MFCPTSIIGLRFGKEGLYCLLYEQPKNKNTYPLCKKHTHYIMPKLFLSFFTVYGKYMLVFCSTSFPGKKHFLSPKQGNKQPQINEKHT